MTSAPVAPKLTFDELYSQWRGPIYGALAAIAEDRDLATDAIDAGFTAWRRKLRKPATGDPAASVAGLAYRWMRKHSGDGAQLSGFRLPRDSEGAEPDVLERLARLDMDERAVLAMHHVLGFEQEDLSRAINADAAQGTLRALTDRLSAEGIEPDRVGATLRAKAASYTVPLSRVESVKAKGALQRAGVALGGVALAGGLLAGGFALFDREAAEPDPGSGPVASGGPALTSGNVVWQRVPLPGAGQDINAIVFDGEEFVLLTMDQRGQPQMFRSTTGLDWAQAPGPQADANNGFWIQSMTAFEDKLVAIGQSFDGARGRENTVVFTSTPDDGWVRSDLEIEDRVVIGDAEFDTHSWVQSVSVTNEGFTLVGNQGAEINPEFLLADVIDPELLRNGWGTSPDGLQFFDNEGREVESFTWEELGLDPEVGSWLSGGKPLLWNSSDGIDWVRADAELPSGIQGVGSYVRGSGFDALLAYGNFGSSLWISRDGEWTRPDIEVVAEALTVFDGKVIVAGVGVEDGVSGIWSSSDGVTWDEAPAPPAAINQFYPSAGGLVGLGWGEAQPVGPAEVEVDGFTLQSFASGKLVLLDSDGTIVLESFDEGLGEQSSLSFTDPDSGEVIVTVDRDDLRAAWETVFREQPIERREPTPSIVISNDGVTWSQLEVDEQGFFPQSLAYGHNSVLMFGWSDGGVFGAGGGPRLLLATPDS